MPNFGKRGMRRVVLSEGRNAGVLCTLTPIFLGVLKFVSCCFEPLPATLCWECAVAAAVPCSAEFNTLGVRDQLFTCQL